MSLQDDDMISPMIIYEVANLCEGSASNGSSYNLHKFIVVTEKLVCNHI